MEAKVGARGQAVIPKPIRDQMGIRPGDKVFFRVEEDRIVIEKGDPEEILEAFLEAYPKRELPENVDWDARYGSQAKERFYEGLGDPQP